MSIIGLAVVVFIILLIIGVSTGSADTVKIDKAKETVRAQARHEGFKRGNQWAREERGVPTVEALEEMAVCSRPSKCDFPAEWVTCFKHSFEEGYKKFGEPAFAV